MIEIRRYHVTDFEAVREILEKGNLYWERSDNEKALERKIKQDPDSILIAVEDERIIGTQFIVEDFLPLLFRLAVHPEYRGKGVGKTLMQRGEQIIREKGYNHVNILVASDDRELQSFYKGQGYERGHIYTWMVKEF